MKTKRILPLLMTAFVVTGCSSTKLVNYDVSEYSSKSDTLKLEYKTGYKIMQLSDLHFCNYDDLDEDFNYLKHNINEANPDLIVLTGDIFTFASLKRVREIFDFINSFGIYWTVTFGNHDEQVYGAYNYPSIYASKLDHCLLNYHDNDALTGTGNTIINLYKDNKVAFQIYSIDSNSYTYDPIGYDYVHQDQIDWYKKGVTKVNSELDPSWTIGSSSTIKSIIFQHIPLVEQKMVLDKISGTPNPNLEGREVEIISYTGVQRESSSPSKYNSGFYQAIKECNSSVAMFVGHDHVNSMDVKARVDGYEFSYCYGAKATDNMYNDDDMIGYRLITLDISTPEIFTTNVVYHTYKEVLA